MIQITKTITQPLEVIEDFADKLGYPVKVINDDYVAPVGSPQIQDPTWVQPDDFDPITDAIPMIDNPDHVPAVGTPTVDNPLSKKEWVSLKFDEMAAKWFSQFAERDALKAAQAQAKVVAEQTEQAVRASINTQM